MNKLWKPRASLSSLMQTRVLWGTRHYHQYQQILFARSQPRSRAPLASHSFTKPHRIRHVSYEQQAKDLNQKGVDKQLDGHDARIAEDQEKQRQAPWHREGSDKAPVHTQRQAGAMTKGKLMCTLLTKRNTHLTRQITYHSLEAAEACSTSEHCGLQQ